MLTHASFFSGVGGTDLGLERAGWHTVSFSEIDPYASAVLAERWPGVPNVGDIVGLAQSVGQQGQPDHVARLNGNDARHDAPPSWHGAELWSGGFPCQDLSVAGKRAGFDGQRSSLAFAFLDLVAAHRPPLVLLENVPGLLSSHHGRDFLRLLNTLQELGYVGSYRTLDAQFFGVPQRRKRLFIVGLDARLGFTANSAAEVLSVGASCTGHPAEGGAKRASVARAAVVGSHDPRPAGSITSTYHKRHDEDTDTHVVGSSPDASGVRATDGLAGRLDYRPELAIAFSTEQTPKGWDLSGATAPTVKGTSPSGGGQPMAVVAATLNSGGNNGGFRTGPGEHLVIADGTGDADLLPEGIDSHRYRCAGNGVVAPVAEWIGWRLRHLAEEYLS